MGKIIMIAALVAVLIRMVDEQFYQGAYTDPLLATSRQVLLRLGH